ncbi:MAG: MopE-related protein [Myxococcales bacterium]|nr:MopE-related protein [Myxococcales bacterium]
MPGRRVSARAFALLPLLLGAWLSPSTAQAQAVKPWFLVVMDTSGSMNDTGVSNSCGFGGSTKMNAAKCALQNILNTTGDAEFGLAQFDQPQNCTGAGGGGGTSGRCDDTWESGMMRVGLSATAYQTILPLVDGVGSGDNTLELCAAGYTPLEGTLRMAGEYFSDNLSPTFPSPTAMDGAVGCRPVSVILLTDGADTCGPGGFSQSNGGDPAAGAAVLRSVTVPVPGGGTTTIDVKTYVIGFGIPENDPEIEAIAEAGGTDNQIDGPGGLDGYYATDEAELSEALARIIFESQLNEVCNGIDDDCDEKVDETHPTYCDIDGIRADNPLVWVPASGTTEDQAQVSGSNLSAYTCSGPNVGDVTACADTPGSCCTPVPGDTDGTPADLAVCASPDYGDKLMCNPLNLLCESPGELCDGQDNDCDGKTDEGPLVGTPPDEECFDGEDDDCDGNTDEGCAGCVPETCDGEDNDCDGRFDEGLTLACGFEFDMALFPDTICRSGERTCVLGQWGAICPAGSACTVSEASIDRYQAVSYPADWVEGEGTCIEPEASESCDALDNDCDTLVDEDTPTRSCDTSDPAHGNEGICREGTQFCDPNAGDLFTAECFFEVVPETEICDGLDNDCDGTIDEAAGTGVPESLTRQCGTDAGICMRGTERCTDGNATNLDDRFTGCTATTPQTEVCNYPGAPSDPTAYDEDCDTRVDESDPTIPATCVADVDGTPITPGPGDDTGLCSLGSVQCVGGELLCRNYQGPRPELCDGLDQDCDGDNANGVGPTTGDPDAAAGTDPSLGTPCFEYGAGEFPGFADALPGLGVCTPGKLVCDVSIPDRVCVGYGLPSAEVCDGIDNDCDAAVDEDVFGPSESCQTGDAGLDPLPYTTPRDFCGECVDKNGDIVVCRASLLDGDDDTATTDASFDCQSSFFGLGAGYGAPIGHGGVSDCCGNYAFSSSWNFGNLEGQHNGAGQCTTGVKRCIGGETVCDGEVTPGDESCDGIDNDCDGETDEYVAAEGQLCGNGTGECVQGNLECTGESGLQCLGFTPPADETCDAKDNDCDGFTDEGNPDGGAACGGNIDNCLRRADPTNTSQAATEACGECQAGIQVCVTTYEAGEAVSAALECQGSVEPIDEKCDGRDNDCDSHCLVQNDGTIICPPDEPDADDKIDEGVEVTDPEIGKECGKDEGVCMKGTKACVAGGYSCQNEVTGTTEVCNGIDDDCDGLVDDGIPVGAPCGIDTGECSPGNLVCSPETGSLVCQGEITPVDEICDGLDNDCDGSTDEGLGLGDACGSDVGLCEKGRFACLDGRLVCQGEVTAAPETCDCEDNDCDGEVDEGDADGLCPGGSACVMCQCALPCTEGMEFSARCPQGKAAVEVNESGIDGCYCVGALCKAQDCAKETIELDGRVACAPDRSDVGECSCKNNECVSRCTGVTCMGGLVCDLTDGRCKEPSCLLTQFACAEGEVCQPVSGAFSCVEDLCADTQCAGDEACRAGECIRSCGRVDCANTERCVDGACVTDHCRANSCMPGQVCDPSDGSCVLAGECVGSGCPTGQVCDAVGGDCEADPCLSTHCPFDEKCDSETGQCELRCGSGLLYCGEEGGCVDPASNPKYCGATGDCMGASAGSECPEGQVCSNGECGDSCSDGKINCQGECIDPASNQLHCGASEDCEGDNAGQVCRTGYACMDGQCISNTAPVDAGRLDPSLNTRLIASGGGGCTCSVPGSSGGAGDSRRGPLSLGLMALSLLILGRRRRRWLQLASHWLPLLLLLALAMLGGCKVDPYCIDCAEDGDAGKGPKLQPDLPSGRDGGTGNGGNDVIDTRDATVGDGATRDALTDCGQSEVCNGVDDDCDGVVDEDVDPAAQGIDFDSDVEHCGGCGQRCQIAHAFPSCVAGECGIDGDQGEGGCDVGFHDLDKNPDNGCEYRCTQSTDDDALCDLIDNDCDGKVDEDIDVQSDPDNCGSCGFGCFFSNAATGASCVAGKCLLDDTKCNDGFRNLDGLDDNGCEWECSVNPPADELCNAKDDDCDGKIDEGVASTDSRLGQVCGTNEGECKTGLTVCKNGDPTFCQGEIGPADHDNCDTKDNDCDTRIDEDDSRVGQSCGNHLGRCETGVKACEGGTIVCNGETTSLGFELCNRIDDDCDGAVDEHVLVDGETGNGLDLDATGGVSCSRASGSLVVSPAAAALGQCVLGKLECRSGQLDCRGEVLARPEQCDNLDWDCDGKMVPDNLAALKATDDEIGPTCGNQLGICTPGEFVCENTGSGASPAWQPVCSEGGVQPEAMETCDGQDDDCDGRIDESTQAGEPIGATGDCHLVDSNDDGVLDQYMGSPNDTGECNSGTSYCVGGSAACIGYQGPSVEICDGLDNDCDGSVDEDGGTRYEGDPCNVLSGGPGSSDTWDLFGICTAGTWDCPAPSGASSNVLVCVGGTRPAADEVCNGEDDDCDGSVDEQWVAQGGEAEPGTSCCPDDPSTPYVDVCGAPNCPAGAIGCAGGSVGCVQNGWTPSSEVCDLGTGVDNDCDGSIDEDYITGDVYDTIEHCGACGNDCEAPGNQVANARMGCIAGSCEIVACEADYYDNATTGAEDCSLYCPAFIAKDFELCDGADNDCDGSIDEAADLEAPVASTFCDQDGACAGSTPICADLGGGDKGWTCTVTAEANDGCDPGNPTAVGGNDDCDGRSDEDVTTIATGFTAGSEGIGVGKPCYGPGTGVCRTQGVQVCGATSTETTCVVSLGDLTEVTENTGARDHEVCDGADNDCDGSIDEPCMDGAVLCLPDNTTCIDANTSSGVLGCVIDGFAQLDASTWVYTHEASRPDADGATIGSSEARACSGGDRLPWTGVSYDEAVAACEAAGARLCTRDDWRLACSCGGTGSGSSPNYDYGWPSGGSCTTSVATVEAQCNIEDPSGAIEPGGTSSSCYITHGGVGVYDLSGNVRELTAAENGSGAACDPGLSSDCRIMVRGGASTNTAVGSACGYEKAIWPDEAPFYNVGFRCCADAP